jgi:D-3-phosphoglycerate dehydrogenase
VIGDGFTDYQIREAGLCKRFFAFTRHKKTISNRKADAVAPSLDEILFSQNLPDWHFPYPKSRIKALFVGEETFSS